MDSHGRRSVSLGPLRAVTSQEGVLAPVMSSFCRDFKEKVNYLERYCLIFFFFLLQSHLDADHVVAATRYRSERTDFLKNH